VIRVVCDVCPDEPGWSGESSAAEWRVSVQTKTGNEVKTADSLDACAVHLGKALAELVQVVPSYANFCRVVVDPVDITGR
jgi:hypothetical protein